jgi:hypothetical protein
MITGTLSSDCKSVSGYIHPGYALALAEFGAPTELPRSGSWFLKRRIPGCAAFDGMGCYPYLACRDWTKLASDLEPLSQDLVSFAAMPDPLGEYTMADLQLAFPDLLIHFKDHFVADLNQPMERIISKHHRKSAEKALLHVEVECHADALPFLDPWMELFSHSIDKFGIKGIPAYSRNSFAQQFALPGTSISLARYRGEIIAAHLQLTHGGAAYAHLAAAKQEAREVGAAFALYYAEIKYFSGKVRWLDWGGEAGLAKNGSLSSFKRGWSNSTRPAFFGGRIFDHELYGQLIHAKGVGAQGYFPAYREGEFA